MNRRQLIQTISREIRTSTKLYTGDCPNSDIADAVAADVLGVIREASMVDDPDGLKELPSDALIMDSEGAYFRYAHDGAVSKWFQPGWTGGRPTSDMQFPVWILRNPEWEKS